MILFKSKVSSDAYVVKVASDAVANQEYGHLILFWVRERALLARLQKCRVTPPPEFQRWPAHFPSSAIYLCELAKVVDRAELAAYRAAA
jgi:hypothetical protein